MVTIGSVGWTLGSAALSRPWLKLRRDQIITAGAIFAAVGMSMVSFYAFTSGEVFLILAIGWIFAGIGMGLSQASTSLAVMELSEVHRQGRNTSSLQVAEGLGSALLVGLAGTSTAMWDVKAQPEIAFGATFTMLTLICIAMVFISTRIGHIANAVAGR
ncbi:MAG: hypothetical protein CSA83_01205 [Actinomycetales bacterium]|nr:MAG: hypothetical protein CSA83_01205 [Actinomycetales bacterium]